MSKVAAKSPMQKVESALREVKLPSGATLKLNPSPFAISKALYQAMLKELKDITISDIKDADLMKSFFCVGFSSIEIEALIWECFKRCTYNAGNGDLRIDIDTFEPVERRQDYLAVCAEVAKENIDPFARSLYAEYKRYMEMTVNIRK